MMVLPSSLLTVALTGSPITVGCDLVNVNRRSGCHIGRDLIRLKVHQADLIGQRLLYRIRVKLDARLAGMHDQIAVLQFPGRIDRFGQRRVRDFVKRAAQAFLIYSCRNLRLSVDRALRR